MVFNSSGLSLSLLNNTSTNVNQPAEYKLKVAITIGTTTTTLTSNNIIWTFPGKPYTPRSILVMPEHNTKIKNLNDLRAVNCLGICSDYVAHLK